MKSRMRSSLLIAALAAAVMLLAARAGGASDPNADRSSPSQSPRPASDTVQEQQRISGTISTMDPSAQTISVKGLLLSKTFTVGSDAQITIEGKSPASLSDLSIGDRVDVTYHTSDKTFVADQVVRVQSKNQK